MPVAEKRQIRFKVPEIQCRSCIAPILNLANDKQSVYVNVATKEALVTLLTERAESDKELLAQYSKELGEVDYTVVPVVAILTPEQVAAENLRIQKQKSNESRRFKKLIIKGVIGLVTGAVLVGLAVSGVMIPFGVMIAITAISGLLTLYLGFDTYRSAWQKLIKTRTLTMDAMFAVSTLAALIVSVIAIAVPWLQMMMDAALLIFGFRHFGLAIEDKLRAKVTQEVKLRDRIPRETLDYKDKLILDVNAIKPGDVIHIKGGEFIPVDGECDDLESSVYNTINDGRGYAKPIRKGYKLLSGMRVGDDVEYMTIKVTQTEENSFLARGDRRMQEAKTKPLPLEVTADKILKYFVPLVFVLAIISLVVISVFFTPALGVICGAGVLVAACPCALGFVIPLAKDVAISKGRKYNAHIKSGEGLQGVYDADTYVFDLNGTLTLGEPIVRSVICPDKKVKKEEVLKILASLEKDIKHAFARAIYDYAVTDFDEQSLPTINKKAEVNGVRGWMGDSCYTVGNLEMMKQHKILFPFRDKNNNPSEQKIYLAKNDQVIAVINLYDPLRADAKSVINGLRKQNKKIKICTGATLNDAMGYADYLGIKKQDVHAACTSEDKLNVVADLKKLGKKVAFVGDAVNDAIVMASCVGFAMQSSSTDVVTEENAQVIIEGSNLSPILAASVIAKQAITNIKMSLGISLTYNMASILVAGGLLVGIGFVLNPGIGAALMVAQTCLILGVAYYYKMKPVAGVQSNKEKAEIKHIDSSDVLCSRRLRVDCHPGNRRSRLSGIHQRESKAHCFVNANGGSRTTPSAFPGRRSRFQDDNAKSTRLPNNFVGHDQQFISDKLRQGI